jgi:hypothetical protein
MNDFNRYWDDEFIPVLKDYLDGELIRAMGAKQVDRVKELRERKEIKDIATMWHLSQMAWYVEHSLADGRMYQLPIHIQPAHDTLTSISYWKNVWHNDLSSVEAQKIKKISELLPKLYGLCYQGIVGGKVI